MAVLLREAIGDRLRHVRTNQRRTLREVSRSARVSLGYLSEVERGRKEASSELLAAICDALDLPLSELLFNVAGDMGALGAVHDVDTVVPDQSIPVEPVIENSARGADAAAVGDLLLGTDLRLQPALTHRIQARVYAA